MDESLLSLKSWDGIPLGEKDAVAFHIETALAPVLRFEGLEAHTLGEQQHIIAMFTNGQTRFALLPGYQGMLGYDPLRHVMPESPPTGVENQQQEESGLRDATVVEDVLSKVLTPLRHVELRPFLIAIDAQLLDVLERQEDGRWHILGPHPALGGPSYYHPEWYALSDE